MPKVSIIMNCLNSSKFLAQALDSIYAQTYSDWEVIFWDNASTDDSAAIAKGYGNKIRYFKSTKTVPLGEARNFALKETKGEYIAFLDCDDKWLPRKLEKQVSVLEENNDVGFVYSNFFILDNINNNQTLALKKMHPQGYIFQEFLNNYSVGILTVMLRKEALKHLSHLFDINLNYAEDYDFFMRVLHETKAVYLKEPLAVYRIHENMSSISLFADIAKEQKYTIEKFKNIYKDFEVKNFRVLKRLNDKFTCSEVWSKMAKGELEAVRSQPGIIRTFNLKLIMLYFASFIPVKLWFVLWDLWSAVKGNKNKKRLIIKSLIE